MVFLTSTDSIFPTASKSCCRFSDTFSTVIVTLIEQGDIIVIEPEPSLAKKWIQSQFSRVKDRIQEVREDRSQVDDDQEA